MWDDYNQIGAKRLDGYLFSHIQRALWRILIIPEVIERKFFCAKAIFECQVHKMGYVSRETVVLRRWWVLQDNLVLSTGLIMWIRYSKEIRFVLTTFWRHLWSITEQTHGNMDSIC